MIKARQVGTADEPNYEIYLINPITEDVALDADGFESIDEAAHFVADLRTAITDTFTSADDIRDTIQITTKKEVEPDES
ncbi:MAG: hypothetical protein LC687_03495 [Actinobacteria bacterium]|nr:hypothetical protein [Actinomycetota bacterium]